MTTSTATGLARRLARVAPGLPALLRYDRADFPRDLAAGLSVAAVALPVGIAYAQLAGFNPAVGLYASILPPSHMPCSARPASSSSGPTRRRALNLSLSLTLTFFTGLLCIGASFLRLGALADLLSKPILVGFMNGVALSILLGQIGKIFGFGIDAGGILPRLFELASKLSLTHWPTLAVGLDLALPAAGVAAARGGPGLRAGASGFHSLSRHPEAQGEAGVVLFRFNGPLVFFNAPYFKREVLKAADSAGPNLKWFIVDMLPVTMIDATGLYAAREVLDSLRARGVVTAAAGRQAEWADWAARRGFSAELPTRAFPTIREALKAYRQEAVQGPINQRTASASSARPD